MHWTEEAAAAAGLTPPALLHAMPREQCTDEDYRVDSMYWNEAGEPLYDAELATKWAERRQTLSDRREHAARHASATESS